MTEISEVWDNLRKQIGIYGHFTRIESPTIAGIPDVAYTLFGCSGWVENKLFGRMGVCPDHLTLEQVLWGEAEVRAGGRWFLFGRNKEFWLLYDIRGARALLTGEPSFPLIQTFKFPLQVLLETLAPPEKRTK